MSRGPTWHIVTYINMNQASMWDVLIKHIQYGHGILTWGHAKECKRGQHNISCST